MQAERARVPATAPADGEVISWSVEPGQTVGRGQELGTFLDEFGEMTITAPCAGVVGRGIAPGAKVKEQAKLVYVESSAPPPIPAQDRYAALEFERSVGTDIGTDHDTDDGTTIGTDSVTVTVPTAVPNAAPTVTPTTVPTVVPVALEESGPIRTEPKTYYYASDQLQAIAGDVAALQDELGWEQPLTETEYARTMAQAFLDLPPSMRLALLRQNRDAELQIGIGAGAKRGRPRKNKNTSIGFSGGTPQSDAQSSRDKKPHRRTPTKR